VLRRFLADGGFKFFVVPPKPTTEAIAALLLQQATYSISTATCTRVVITEGPHNQAEVAL